MHLPRWRQYFIFYLSLRFHLCSHLLWASSHKSKQQSFSTAANLFAMPDLIWKRLQLDCKNIESICRDNVLYYIMDHAREYLTPTSQTQLDDRSVIYSSAKTPSSNDQIISKSWSVIMVADGLTLIWSWAADRWSLVTIGNTVREWSIIVMVRSLFIMKLLSSTVREWSIIVMIRSSLIMKLLSPTVREWLIIVMIRSTLIMKLLSPTVRESLLWSSSSLIMISSSRNDTIMGYIILHWTPILFNMLVVPDDIINRHLLGCKSMCTFYTCNICALII